MSKSERQESEKPATSSLMVINPDTLLGQWVRPDGNYVLEIKAVKENDKLEATYYNPSPIKVAVAELKEKNPPEIYVEFDDVNYRGSYYDLKYNLSNDILEGVYFQASYGQTYHIAFVRMQDQ